MQPGFLFAQPDGLLPFVAMPSLRQISKSKYVHGVTGWISRTTESRQFSHYSAKPSFSRVSISTRERPHSVSPAFTDVLSDGVKHPSGSSVDTFPATSLQVKCLTSPLMTEETQTWEDFALIPIFNRKKTQTLPSLWCFAGASSIPGAQKRECHPVQGDMSLSVCLMAAISSLII